MNYYNPYGNMQGQAQPMTNKIYVTSGQEALSRFANFNSVTVYFSQDESTIFEVYTDMQGNKSIKARKLVDLEPAKPKKGTYITRAEFDEFKASLTPKKEIEEDVE